jgi:hypothetical protein
MKDPKFKNIDFQYSIINVGVISINGFDQVVSEIRYNFEGYLKRQRNFRFTVHHLDTSQINPNNFVKFEDISVDLLVRWIEESINPSNLLNYKQEVYDKFFPPIVYHPISDFKQS